MQQLGKILNFQLPDDREPVDWSQESQTVGQMPDWYEAECPTCCGTGYVQVIDETKMPGEPGWQYMTHCTAPDCPVVKRHHDERYEALVSRAPLPPEYRSLTFDSWYDLADSRPDLLERKWLGYGAALAFVRAAGEGYWFTLQDAYACVGIDKQAPNNYPKNSLVLAGQPGVGKTSLAACVVNSLRGDRVPALYIRVNNLLDALKEPMNKYDQDYMYEFGKTEQQILDTFSKAPVLVLDEFNLSRVSDYSSQRLEDIVRHRMSNQLPTVMTTNLTNFDDFNEHWGYRVGHAVQGMSHWIVMGGYELRRRGGPVESE